MTRSASATATCDMRRIAFFLSADSFEGFYGGIFGLDRETFLSSYRNDFVWEYAEGLCQRGHTVTLYILSYGRPERRSLSERLGVRFVPLPRWFRFVDPFTYRLAKLPAFGASRDRFAYLAYGRAFQRALREDGIDVLYHQEIWTPRFDVMTERVTRPIIGAEHGAMYAPWMEAAKRRSLPRAAFLTCQSKEALARAHQFGGRADLFYNGIDTDFFTPPATANGRGRTILTVGRLVEDQKRFTDLLRAMQLLSDFTLKIVGSGPAEALLRQTAQQLGVSERVQFLGFLSDRAALRQLYQECGVFVSTSAWEAVALVVLEAMSCETPVVCTEIPSFQELLRDGVNGLLVPIGAPERVAEAVRTAMEQAESLGQKARQTVVAHYSASGLYDRLSELVCSVQTRPETLA